MNYKVKKVFERQGIDACLIEVENGNIKAEFLNFAATIVSLRVLDKNGEYKNVILTHYKIEDYYDEFTAYGNTCGRTAGRIENGKFTINGNDYVLDTVNDGSTLHGGAKGVTRSFYDFEVIENKDCIDVVFSLVSKDMEEGYPGDLSLEVKYSVFPDKILISYKGSTTKDTLCNITNHAYFNLSGDYSKTIHNQYLKLNCDKYVRLDNNLIGVSIDSVKDTLFDFTSGHAIGDELENDILKKSSAKGYDHPLVINKDDDVAAIAYSNDSGIELTVKTSYPTVVFYTTNNINDLLLEGGYDCLMHSAFCLECQYIPNGINMSGVNKAILKKEEMYDEFIEWNFALK